MKKVLITGGAGFIGSEIVSQLFKSGDWEITVLDSMTTQVHGKDWSESYLYKKIRDKCNFIYGDVRNLDDVKKAISGNDYIIHLAAETGTGQSMYEINRYNEVNVMGTSNIFQAISSEYKNSIKKIVLASSRAVYGEGKYQCKNCGVVYPKGRKKEQMQNGNFQMYCPFCKEKILPTPTTEDSFIQPGSLYAFTKYAQEKLLETMCSALEIDYTIFRLQNVYGSGQSLKNPYTGILSVFSNLLLKGQQVNIFEDGLESRDFINVIDVAVGIITSLDCQNSNTQIINLGSGVGTTVIEIAQILKEKYNSSSILKVTGDFRIGDIAFNMADISKAKCILGFQQTVSLDYGLDSFCKWVLSQKSLLNNVSLEEENNYKGSLDEMEKTGMFIRNNTK